MGESSRIHGGLRQGCAGSPWLFCLFVDGAVRKIKARSGRVGMDIVHNGSSVPTIVCILYCFADRVKRIYINCHEFKTVY